MPVVALDDDAWYEDGKLRGLERTRKIRVIVFRARLSQTIFMAQSDHQLLEEAPMRHLPHAQLQLCSVKTFARSLSFDTKGNGPLFQRCEIREIKDVSRKSASYSSDCRRNHGVARILICWINVDTKIDFLELWRVSVFGDDGCCCSV